MGNPIRFTGLASGLDTESIVKAIMTPYQSKIDTLNKNKILSEWRKDAYKEMSNKLQDFKNNALDKIKYASTLNESKVEVSQEGFIDVDTNSYKEDGTHQIEVEQLASGANVESSAIKGADGSKYTKDSLVSSITGTSSGSFEINGVKVEFDSSTTIEELETKVSDGLKAAGHEDISFKYDEGAGGFLINSTKTGEKQEITITDSDGTLQKLGIKQGTYSGTDARIKYNGGLTITSETNSIEVNGIKFEAKAETTTPITVTVSKDIDAMVEAVTDFVGEYNKLLTEMDKKLSADSAKGYDPLTEEEKDAMTDKEIELWENKIKDSLLADNDSLSDVYGSLRGIMAGDHAGKEGIEDGYSMLAQIGIKSTGWKDKGKVSINEEDLREAIINNGDAVVSLVTTIGDEMSNKLIEMSRTSDLRTSQQFFNDKLETQKIDKYKDDLVVAKARYERLENMYYAKFTAMEQAMQEMNSQSSMFAGM